MHSKKTLAIFILFGLVFLPALQNSSFGAVIEGVIFSPAGPIAKARVYAYPDHDSLQTGKNAKISLPGEKPGQYRLEIPIGKYFLEARGSVNDKEMYAYHGVNPVTIINEYNWIPFFTVPESVAECREGPQGISGQVTFKGEPVSGGVASIYDVQNGLYRGMGLLTNTIDETGNFWFNLEPGNYIVVARKRLNGSGIGPVKSGDLYCYPSANPIQIRENMYCEVKIGCYPRNNLTAYLDEEDDNPQGRRMAKRKTASFRDLQIMESAGQSPAPTRQTADISGKVTDLTGKPLAGLFVTAYPALGLDSFQMYIVRMISSFMAKTDAQGNYTIKTAHEGKYYLVAREKTGEAPARLEFYGLYEGNSNHSILVETEKIYTDIDFRLKKIMPFTDQNPDISTLKEQTLDYLEKNGL